MKQEKKDLPMSYPLLQDNSCNFIAADFDNHNGDREPLQDVKAYCEACQIQDIPCYALRSKSGKGYHVYIFFSTPVPAWKARVVAFALLQEAGVIGDDVKLSSFDRLFPNQDELTGKKLGNLIALPFQGQAAHHDNTLFLNPDTNFIKPFDTQYAFCHISLSQKQVFILILRIGGKICLK